MNYLNKLRFSWFSGWWIVGAFFIITVLTAGFVTLSFTAFIEPIREEFGWSYTQISSAASLRGVEAALLAPLVGVLIDRWGPRPLMFVGILAISGGLLFLGNINSLVTYYLSFAIISIGLGGPSATVAATTMAHWFPKRLGIAMGIIGSGFALGGPLVPLVVKIIEATDWRTALMILGASILVICLPLSLLIRFRTKKYSYESDVAASPAMPAEPASAPGVKPEVSLSLKKALLSRTFWHIELALIVFHFIIATVTTHIMPYLSTMDFNPSTASLIWSAIPLLSIAGRLGSGWTADRYGPKIVTLGLSAIFFLGIICLNLASDESIWIFVPYVILYGIGWGGLFTMRASLVREYFGRSNYGSIYGFMQGISALSLLGPIFAGWVFDTWNGYQIVWQIYAVLAFLAIIAIFTLPSTGNSPGHQRTG